MAKPRKMYASFTNVQKESGFAKKMGRETRLGKELESQANAGALDDDKVFQKNRSRKSLKSGWSRAQTSTRNKGIRSYVKGGATSAQGKRAYTRDTNSIKFAADPKNR